jgi:hypothetical protein
MKILTIVKDNRITGVEYGVIEVPDKQIRKTHEQKVAKEYTQTSVRNKIKLFQRQNQK